MTQAPTLNEQTTPHDARAAFRRGLVRSTAGISAGFVQTNLLAVPKEYAFDFLLFAHRNPKPCPIIEVLEAGQLDSPIMSGGDIRTDLPAYRVYRDGELVDEVSNASDVWRDDLVAFLIGCSFTFETAMLAAGLTVAHIDQGCNVPMYRTNMPTRRAGVFGGPMVVSMRPFPAHQVADAVRITARFPSVHGAPVHVGDPEAIGIADLAHPDFGDPVAIKPGEIPVFWGCGVTPQQAVMDSRPSFAISHAPGHMLITDARDSDYQVP